MTTRGFSGGAGTGKTTGLLRELDAALEAAPLQEGQRVLALTFMHGSRRRLTDRLAVSKARRQCDCMTIDRFAWEVCRRWRTRLRAAGESLSPDPGTGEFDAMCAAAGRLLAFPEVVRWITRRYPIVILDEFQDCAEQRVSITKALHGQVQLLIAADDFQNLNLSVESPAVAWLRSLGVCQELTVNHRTTEAALLKAACALRDGTPLVPDGGKSFMLMSMPTAAVAASYISKTLWPSTGKNAVVLSPSRGSKWVQQVIGFVGTKKYGAKRDVGPVAVQWEAGPEAIEAKALADLGLQGDAKTVAADRFQCLGGGPLSSRLKRWADHQRRILGRTQFSAEETRTIIKRSVHQIRSFGSSPVTGRRAMTIHQAKNREFEVVIVLWPFELPKEPVQLRRLLYNAVTRARRRAIVIVHDPKKNRLNSAPFAGATPPVPPNAEVESAARTLYFAYGSNMWEEQMRRRCRNFEKVGRAVLHGHRWIINSRGVATTVAAPESMVEGTLFRISEADEKSLDDHEHVAEGAYRKERCTVHCDGVAYPEVLIYVDPITTVGLPREEYIGRINRGAQDARLSEGYLAGSIRAFVPAPGAIAKFGPAQGGGDA